MRIMREFCENLSRKNVVGIVCEFCENLKYDNFARIV